MSADGSGDDGGLENGVLESRVLVGSGALYVWPVVARIWRTVDVDRTVAALGLVPAPIADDELLGARGVLVRPPGEAWVAVLEPATEGRLAAALARDDEGEAGAYVAPMGGLEEALAAEYTLVARGEGPFGESALVTLGTGVPTTRFTIIVESPPATIDE